MPNNPLQQAMWVISGDPETSWETTAPIPGQLGRFATVKNATSQAAVDAGDVRGRDKTYRYIKVDSSAMSVNPAKSLVAWWVDKSRFTVGTSPTAQGRGRVAGVFQGPIPRGSYGFIQVAGAGLVKFQGGVQGQAEPTATPTSAGLHVIPSAIDGKADCLAAGSAATYPIIGYSASAMDATNYTATVDLEVPDIP